MENVKLLSFSVTIKSPTMRHKIIKFARSCWGELVEDNGDCFTFSFDWKEGLDAFIDGLKTIK